MKIKRAVIRNGKIVYDADSKVSKPNTTEAHRRREDMKINHRKDLLQPTQVDFMRAYPKEGREIHGDDAARRLS